MRRRGKNTQKQTWRHGRDQEQGSSTSARTVRELVSATIARVMATLRASVPPRATAKDSRRAPTRERGKGMSTYGPIRISAKGKGKSKGPIFGNLLDMRRRALCGELPQGQGPQPSGGTRGFRPVGARGMGEPGDPHPIAHPGAGARPKAGGRKQGGLDVDRFRERSVADRER